MSFAHENYCSDCISSKHSHTRSMTWFTALFAAVLIFAFAGSVMAQEGTLDSSDIFPNGEPPPEQPLGRLPSSETDVDNGDGTWTFTQQIDENSSPPHYLGPWNSWKAYGFQEYSWYNQDYGWLHNFPHWNDPTLNILSATMTIHAWDIDSETRHGYDGEYDGAHVDGNLLSPGYLQGNNNEWSTTVFDLPLSSIIDDGDLNVFMDIDMHHTDFQWATTLDYSRVQIVYSMTPNDPPYQPELSFNLNLITNCLEGGLCVQEGQDLVVSVDGPVPADPNGDVVTYTYRWFVDIGTGGFVDDEFAGRGDHTGNTVPTADIVSGDTWQVQVTPTDEFGAIGDFATITFNKVCPDVSTCNNPPVALCQDKELSADANCQGVASINFGSNDPDGDPITIVETPTGPYPVGVTVVTLIVTDDSGLADTCTATVTVTDNDTPVVTCPADITATTDPGLCTAVVSFNPTAIDNCSTPTIISTPASGSVFGLGLTTVEVIATDASGNADTCQFTVTVTDETSPSLVGCPSDLTVDCDAIPAVASVTATDVCDGVLAVTFGESEVAGACGDAKTITRTWTATDANGNSTTCTQVITVLDTTAPILVGCPVNDTVECNAIPVAAVLTATDNCDASPEITFDETTTPGAGGSYTLTRTWTATDDCGNSSSCVQIITVQDTTDPVLAGCPSDLTVDCDAIPTAATVTATDVCDGVLAVTFGETTTSGSCDDSYTITRTWTATDASGNSTTCTQVITVDDTTAPVLAGCPADITVECDAIPAVATPTATDNCDASPTVTFAETETAGACANTKTITRTWTATDNCGNSSSCTQVIIVQDTTAPVLAGCPADITVECDAIPTPASVIATDNCEGVTIDFFESEVAGACGNEKTITRTWTATDACGNSSSCSQTIIVEDTTDPVLAGCPADVTVECDAIPAAATLTATDNCDVSPVITFSETEVAGACGNNKTITRTWTATDACGNSTFCSQTIIVEDTTDPVLTGCPADVTVECDAVPAVATLTVTDNCGAPPIIIPDETIIPGSCDNEYTIIRTWTATNDCGNNATCTQVITVVDTTDPVLAGCPADVTVECNAIPTPATVTATDNCDLAPIVTYAETTTPGSGGSYTLTRTWTATDDCGNSSSCTQVITVQDTTEPVLAGCPDNVTVECDAIPAPATVTATDVCDGVLSVTFVENTTSGSCDDSYTITRTWTATDASGNSSSCTQIITVADSTPPVLAGCPADETVACDAIPAVATPTAIDNCDASPVITFDETEVLGACVGAKTITRTWTATDACGNASSCTQIITVEDNTNPVCSVPADTVLVMCDASEICLPIGCTDNCDPNPVISILSGPGTIVNGEWCYTPTVSETASVQIKCMDACGNICVSTFNVTFQVNNPPVCEVPDNQTIFQCAPAEVCLPVGCTDPDGNILNNQPTMVSGPGAIVNGEWCYTPTGNESVTVTIQCADDCGATSQCSFTIDFVMNTAPVCSVPDDQILFQCEASLISLPVSCTDVDDNVSGGSPSIISGPGAIVSGNWEYTPSGDESFTVVIGCTDDCGASSQCSFDVAVTINKTPVCEVPADQTINQCSPEQVCLPVGCNDPDNNPAGTQPTLISGPGAIISGEWCYTPAGSEVATVTVQCEDECGATCQSTFEITFVVNSAPVCAVPDDQTIFQCVPEEACFPVGCTDVDGNLLSNQPTIISGPGAIVNGEWCYTPIGPEVVSVTIQCEDDCGLVCQKTFVITFDVNVGPVCQVPNDTSFVLCEPTQVCLPVSCTDDDDNLTAATPIVKYGPGTIVDGEWCYTAQTNETAVVTIECEDECGATSQCTFTVEFTVNSAPVIVDCPGDTTVPWLGSNITRTITATDADGEETVTFSLGTGSPGSIDASGNFTWNTSGSSVCGGDVIIIATDDCDMADTCTFNVCVTNEPPTIVCSDPEQICWGSTLNGQVSATDPDGGPINLFYSVISFDGPGTVTIDGATGEYTWVTSETPEYAGTFELCIEVTDNANLCSPCSPTNADTCCISLTVVPAYQVVIEKTHGTLQGHYVNVAIYLDSVLTYSDFGGFDLLIAYDASALTFSGATQGQMLTDCGWEYFTYRFGADGNCGSGCPSGELRMVGIAETNNGDNHPICRTNDGVSSILADLSFLVSNDRTLECNYVPIRFHWYDCPDNTISSPGGDTLYIASAVYDYRPLDGLGEYQDITNTISPFPSYTGAHFSCDDGSNPAAKFEPLRCLEFYNGGVDIICADSIDARGDLNLDGLAYTISDAVMYINYFIYGMQAFTDITAINSYGFAAGYEGSVAASDVNADGLTLSVSDMVYLIRVIVGDAIPYPKVSPIEVDLSNEKGVLSVDLDMGAAYLLVSGEETPVLLANNVDMKYSHKDGNTRIIIYSLSSESFKDEFLAIEGNIISLEMATYEGQPATTVLIPSEFSLNQNYPNPFNPKTMIGFQLPEATQVILEVYNVKGQKVITLVDEYLQAGTHQFPWESTGASSGVYFYRLETNSVTETRKMILLK